MTTFQHINIDRRLWANSRKTKLSLWFVYHLLESWITTFASLIICWYDFRQHTEADIKVSCKRFSRFVYVFADLAADTQLKWSHRCWMINQWRRLTWRCQRLNNQCSLHWLGSLSDLTWGIDLKAALNCHPSSPKRAKRVITVTVK